MVGGAAQVGQRHHAAHGMSGKRKGACDTEGYEQVGELVDVVGVHRCGRGVAVAAVVVADDPDAVAVLTKQGSIWIVQESLFKHNPCRRTTVWAASCGPYSRTDSDTPSLVVTVRLMPGN